MGLSGSVPHVFSQFVPSIFGDIGYRDGLIEPAVCVDIIYFRCCIIPAFHDFVHNVPIVNAEWFMQVLVRQADPAVDVAECCTYSVDPWCRYSWDRSGGKFPDRPRHASMSLRPCECDVLHYPCLHRRTSHIFYCGHDGEECLFCVKFVKSCTSELDGRVSDGTAHRSIVSASWDDSLHERGFYGAALAFSQACHR